jgi:hypothetical protein
MAKFFTRRLGKFPVEIVEISAFWVEAQEPEYLEQNFSLFFQSRQLKQPSGNLGVPNSANISIASKTALFRIVYLLDLSKNLNSK